MPKLFFFLCMLLFLLTGIEAKDIEENKVILQAEEIGGDTEHLYANGHITLHYDKTTFLAEHAAYDKNAKVLSIYGKVKIINPDGSHVKTDKVTLQTAQQQVKFEKFFYANNEDIWLSSDIAVKSRECYRLKQAMFSTCAVTNPDWHLAFSEADYNSTSKYIKLRDIKFYIGETPIFYFPYLAFSTSRERSSGLLMPYLGYNAEEGFIYEQPIYWAINPSMDIEFNPQIRTERGIGMYTTFRFADSSYSEGELRVGYFKDTDTYVNRYDLENNIHYGLEGFYTSNNIFAKYRPEGYEDGLYSNVVLFNDIDYLNLQKKRLAHLTDSHLKESRFNYLLYNDNNYYGVNAKYFLDANKENNEDTLQELPSLHWHLYDHDLDSLAFSYNIDAKLTHYMRTIGTVSKQLEISVPIQYTFSLLDDYLKVEIGEELYAFSGKFQDTENVEDESYKTLIATHKFKLYTDLVKSYEKGVHTMELALEYAKQDYLGDGLNEYLALDNTLRKDFLSRKPFDDKVTFSLNQYWHTNILDMKLVQRMSQEYYPNRIEEWGELSHELSLHYDKWHIQNLLKYSFEYNAFSEMSNKLHYQDDKVYFDIEHFWRKELETGHILTNEIAFDTKYQYNQFLNIFAGLTYDLEQKESQKWYTGVHYDKGCWSVELSYVHDTKPFLSKDGGGSVSNNTFLIKLNLVPFGESELRQ